jgi:hypothetical protein
MCNQILTQERLEAVVNYYKKRSRIESFFIGLPDGPSSLIKSLITMADPVTGIVSDISYHDLANLLTIHPAPGRKNSGTPSKQTIRNYIKSIENECGQYFKVISEGQKLQFLFPELPKIFNEVFGTQEVNTEVNLSETVTHTEQNNLSDTQDDTEVNIELNTPINAVKNIIFNNINNNNNNNILDKKFGNKNTPKTISQNFYPSQEIITRAIAAGHNNATDADIIQEFIDKNTAWGSTFADFNPIYLSFLAKHAERKQQESATSSTQTRSKNNERASTKVNSYDAALEEVRRNNPSACKPSTDELFPTAKVIVSEFEYEPPFVAMGGVNQDLRSFVSY